MRHTLVLLCLALACLSATQAAVYRRGDKISENFKQLDLAPEEIDPDVAPLGAATVENFDDTTDDSLADNADNADNEIVDEAEELALAAAEAENEIIEESANEVVAQAAPTKAPAAAVATTAAPAVQSAAPLTTEDDAGGLAKYCKCTGNHCDCCRTFNLPFIPIKGPGCARMTYLGDEKMSVSLKYGDLTLASRTVSSKRARPICVGLPGGYSQFCGRVYGLGKAQENFKACLGFELRADDEVEAALRVSCFKFGPEGLRVAEAEPLPSEANKEEDDDDDIFGFGAGGGADDEDDYDEEEDDEEEADDEEETDADYADDESEDAEEAPVDADYGGFSLAGLLDELDDDEDEETKPSSTPAAAAIAAPVSSLATLAPEPNTRTAVAAAQSKDDMGMAAVPATEAAAIEAFAASLDGVTPAPQASPEVTTAKTKKSKKTKKNKKKKAVDSEDSFAYDILNGLLAFFN